MFRNIAQHYKAMGVRDSKDMTDEQIKALVPKSKEAVPYKFINALAREKYNEVQQVKNLNEIRRRCFITTFRLLSEKLAHRSSKKRT